MSVLASPQLLPEHWCAEERGELAALACLPGMTATMLRELLGLAGPRRCFAAARVGSLATLAEGLPAARRRRIGALAPRWRAAAGEVEPGELLARWRAGGLDVLVAGDAAFPAGVARHSSGPLVLFARGRPVAPGRARVAVMGTRSSTAYGERVASALSRGLAGCGIDIVTSLEPGIDAAVRCGGLGVRGGGVTVFAAGGADGDRLPGNPAQAVVAGGGLVASDAPFGAPPERWRFPRRNRLVACAGDVVVLVEAHAAGGALRAAEAALELGVPVCAVPGSVRSPSSRGTNALLADGAHLVRDLEDVLAVLELTCAARFARPLPPAADRPAAGAPTGLDGAVLSCIEVVVTPLERVLERSGADLAEVALSLERLVEAGLIEREPAGYLRL